MQINMRVPRLPRRLVVDVKTACDQTTQSVKNRIKPSTLLQLGERVLTLQTSARRTFYRPSVQRFARSEFIDGATCMLCARHIKQPEKEIRNKEKRRKESET